MFWVFFCLMPAHFCHIFLKTEQYLSREERGLVVPTTINTKFTHPQLAVPSVLNTSTLQGRKEQTFPCKWISFWYEPFRDYIHFNLGRDPRLTSLLLLTELCLQKHISSALHLIWKSQCNVALCTRTRREERQILAGL